MSGYDLTRTLRAWDMIGSHAATNAAETYRRLCQTNANQVEFVIPGFRWTAQNTCDFQQPLGD
jgi:hypothetical protein